MDGGRSEKILSEPADQFCMAEKMIYYINKSDRNRIYRADMEGKNNVRLGKNSATNLFSFMDYSDGRLYYISLNDGNRVYSVDYKGNDKKKESSNGADCINSDGFMLYYSNRSDEGKIYKMDLGNGSTEKLNDDTNCEKINIEASDMIYLSNGIQKYASTYNGAPLMEYDLESREGIWKDGDYVDPAAN